MTSVPILADLASQLPSPAVAAVTVLMGITLLATTANQGLALMSRLSGRDPGERRISPQPLEVRESPAYVTEPSLALRHAPLVERMGRLEAALETARRDAAAERQMLTKAIQELETRLGVVLAQRDENIHGRINELLVEVGKLIGTVRGLGSQPTCT